MKKIFYNGNDFNSYNRTKTIKLYNKNLVKQDILNHIFTRKGERVMLPKFGTNIPDLIMEPLDNVSIESIRNDLITVFEYDPRVVLTDLLVRPIYDEKVVVAIADLFYVELKFKDMLDIRLEFNN